MVSEDALLLLAGPEVELVELVDQVELEPPRAPERSDCR
jgi:hypothetical protein